MQQLGGTGHWELPLDCYTGVISALFSNTQRLQQDSEISVKKEQVAGRYHHCKYYKVGKRETPYHMQ